MLPCHTAQRVYWYVQISYKIYLRTLQSKELVPPAGCGRRSCLWRTAQVGGGVRSDGALRKITWRISLCQTNQKPSLSSQSEFQLTHILFTKAALEHSINRLSWDVSLTVHLRLVLSYSPRTCSSLHAPNDLQPQVLYWVLVTSFLSLRLDIYDNRPSTQILFRNGDH